MLAPLRCPAPGSGWAEWARAATDAAFPQDVHERFLPLLNHEQVGRVHPQVDVAPGIALRAPAVFIAHAIYFSVRHSVRLVANLSCFLPISAAMVSAIRHDQIHELLRQHTVIVMA